MRSRAPPVADAARRGAPAAVEKIEQASSAKIFSGTARRWGQMRLRLPLERICAQYGVRFFSPEKSKFVASTAKRQRGLQRGKPGSPLPCFASFCRSKRKAPAASGAYYDFAKGSVTPTGDHNLGLIFLLPTFLLCLVKKEKAAFLRLFFVVETHGLEPWTSCV